MRVIVLIATFIILKAGMFGSELTYLIADGGLGADDIHIIGMTSNEEILEAGDITVEKVKTYNYKDSENADVEVGLFKISIGDGGAGSKIVVGYKQDGNYILLSTSKAGGEENIADNYGAATGAEDYLRLINPQDYIDEKIFYTESPYERFPGYEVDEGRIIMGMRVGDEEIEAEGRTEPSNIVEKFFTEVDAGEEVYIKAGINPNNSSDEFKVTDKSGKALIVMKKEKGTNYMVVGDYTFGLKNKKADLNAKDEFQVVGDGVYLDSNKIIDGEAPFEVTIRIKKKLTTSNENSTVKIDGEYVSFSGDTKNYSLSNVDNFILTYSGNGNGFDFEMNNEDGNDSVVTGEGSNTKEADVVYVIEGVGTRYEGSVEMSSESEGSGRQRMSDVKIEVLVDGEEGIEIESISE